MKNDVCTTVTIVPTGKGGIFAAVGFGDCDRTLLNTEETSDSLLAKLVELRPKLVRVIGARECAGIIVKAHEAISAAGWQLQIGSPGILGGAGRRKATPESLLRQTDRLTALPASLGGWHDSTAVDLLSYALCLTDDTVEALDRFRQHPVCKVVSFFKPDCFEAGVRFVNEIRDPRWFADPQEPDSPRKLFEYLGLYEKVLQNLSITAASETSGMRRARCVLSLLSEQEVSDAGSSTGVLLAAARKRTACICAFWTAVYYPGIELFLPADFLDGAQLTGFIEHISRMEAVCAN